MKTENETIAEFMDLKLTQEDEDMNWTLDKAPYNSDWNWLMPVVEKIESLGYFLHIQFLRSEKYKRQFCNITSSNHEMISDSFAETKIQAVYNAVVGFINFYNTQKK